MVAADRRRHADVAPPLSSARCAATRAARAGSLRRWPRRTRTASPSTGARLRQPGAARVDLPTYAFQRQRLLAAIAAEQPRRAGRREPTGRSGRPSSTATWTALGRPRRRRSEAARWSRAARARRLAPAAGRTRGWRTLALPRRLATRRRARRHAAPRHVAGRRCPTTVADGAANHRGSRRPWRARGLGTALRRHCPAPATAPTPSAGQSRRPVAGVLSLLALDERPHPELPAVPRGLAATAPCSTPWRRRRRRTAVVR